MGVGIQQPLEDHDLPIHELASVVLAPLGEGSSLSDSSLLLEPPPAQAAVVSPLRLCVRKNSQRAIREAILVQSY